MVRNYKRKTNRGQDKNWSSTALIAAIDEVKAGSKRPSEASQTYAIPETTLRRYLKQTNDQFPIHGGRYRQVFPDLLEIDLCQYMIEMSARGFGMTRQQICAFAYELAEKNQLAHTFDRNQERAGRDWLDGFLRRHPNLSVRASEATSLGRMMGFNKPQVDQFFDVLFEAIQRYRFSPSRIYNCDESGLPTVPTKLPKVLAVKGAKRVPKVTSAERGKNITFVCCMSASGSYIPPAFIYPRKKMRDELLIGAPADAIGIAYETGWMTAEVFVKYLQHVVKHSRPTKDDPILLILDNHASHVSLSAVDFCRDHGIVMVSLPPHCTHRLQPLDVSFFGPLKTDYSRACDAWMTNHPGKPITEFHVASIVCGPYQKASTVAAAANGFRASGIYPLNRDVFTDADFCAAITTEREENDALIPTVPSLEIASVTPVISGISSVSIFDGAFPVPSVDESALVLPIVPTAQSASVTPVISGTSSVSIFDGAFPVPSVDESALALLMVPTAPLASEVPIISSTSLVSIVDGAPTVGSKETPPSNETEERPMEVPSGKALSFLVIGTPSSTSNHSYVSPLSIRPYSSAARSSTTRKRKAVKAQIITASPYKNELLEKKRIRDSIEEKRKSRRKLNLTLTLPDKRDKKIGEMKNNRPVADKRKQKNEPKSRKSKVRKISDVKCPACDEVGGAEQWVQCGQCKTWWHEACSAYEGHGSFVCDFC